MASERTTSSRYSDEAIGQALLRYRVMATIVGVLLIALVLVAVPLKYLGDVEAPVQILGTAHGWLYLLFFLSAIDLALRARWSPKGTALTVIAGTVPVLSFVAERRATAKTRAGQRV